MSWDLYSMARSLRLPPTPKAVLKELALICRNDEGKEIYPAIETLVEYTSFGERTVQDALSYLLDVSLLRIEGTRNGGRRVTTTYCINLDELKGAATAPFKNYPTCAEIVEKLRKQRAKGAGAALAKGAGNSKRVRETAEKGAGAAPDTLYKGEESENSKHIVETPAPSTMCEPFAAEASQQRLPPANQDQDFDQLKADFSRKAAIAMERFGTLGR